MCVCVCVCVCVFLCSQSAIMAPLWTEHTKPPASLVSGARCWWKSTQRNRPKNTRCEKKLHEECVCFQVPHQLSPKTPPKGSLYWLWIEHQGFQLLVSEGVSAAAGSPRSEAHQYWWARVAAGSTSAPLSSHQEEGKIKDKTAEQRSGKLWATWGGMGGGMKGKGMQRWILNSIWWAPPFFFAWHGPWVCVLAKAMVCWLWRV